MSQSLDRKVSEWRDADSRARKVEKALASLPLGRGEALPPAELVSEAKMLRRVAEEKLKAAIAAMRPTA